MNETSDQTSTLFTFNDVPVKARRDFWLMPFLLPAAFTWIAGKRYPHHPLRRRLLFGLLAAPLTFSADLGHALSHTVTARLADAPTDTVLLSAGMPRTLYRNNEVPPRVHILRSLGGPLSNLLGLSVSLLWRHQAAPASLSRELAETSAAAHAALAFGSFLPLPIIDGGVILKWSLVRRGHPPAQAGQIVNRASIGLGAAAFTAASLLFALGRRTLALLLAIGGALATAAGLEWLK